MKNRLFKLLKEEVIIPKARRRTLVFSTIISKYLKKFLLIASDHMYMVNSLHKGERIHSS
jgi:hypothetical protein